MKTLVCTASSLRVRATPDGADTGSRVAQGATVNAHGQSFDGRWYFIEAGQLAGWASADYLRPQPADLPKLKAPSGYAGIVKMFGEPGNPACQRGRVTLPRPLPLSWNRGQNATMFACHEKVAPYLQAAFDDIEAQGLSHLLEDFGGCYADRVKRGTTSKTSTHAWGIGIDINVASNPQGKRPKLDPRIVTVFESHGFEWGGRWSRPDGMHFQFARGY